jgi:hypothetical protein
MHERPSPQLGGESFDRSLRVLVPAPRIELPSSPSVSVIIPAMNEARNLPWLAERMPQGVAEIILVDGRSVDDTIEVARSLWPDIRILSQTRSGKGNALACGYHAAIGDIIVTIDADGSMDPGEIPYFVAALEAGADFAQGSRFAPGGGSADLTRFRKVGVRALDRLTRLIHKTSHTDLVYGYRAFWRRVLPLLDLDGGQIDDDSSEKRWGDGFEVETLINIRVHLAGLAVAEVPSFEGARLHGLSNLHAVSDGCRVLRIIARESHALRRGAQLRREVVATLIGPRPAPAGSTADVYERGGPSATVVPAVTPDVIDISTYEREQQASVDN